MYIGYDLKDYEWDFMTTNTKKAVVAVNKRDYTISIMKVKQIKEKHEGRNFECHYSRKIYPTTPHAIE